MKSTVHVYVKKGNVGYDFYRGYKYDTNDGRGHRLAVGNTFTVTKTTLYGFTWTEELDEFDSADEGNNFFKTLVTDGYQVCDKSEYDSLRPWD